MNSRGAFPVLLLVLALVAPPGVAESLITAETLAPLPDPVSNNALALVASQQSIHIHSFLGLGSGKKRSDILRSSFAWDSLSGQWSRLPDVPVDEGRLAATAVTVGRQVYLFGGYSVAAYGGEVSTPGVFRLDDQGILRQVSKMPVPVDDTVALVYMNRYVYLVSGWHDVGNVNLVQVYDSVANTWQQAEPWPGAPVFGHAGGISGKTMVICDGVRVAYPADPGPRQFLPSAECWLGEVSETDVRRIAWRRLDKHPGAARYRMAATGVENQVVFAGGTDNPYNYDGVGYDGAAAEPIPAVFSFNIDSGEWRCQGNLAIATMDHRALLAHDGWFYLAGGMLASQEVSDKLIRFRLPAEDQPCQE